MEVCTGLIWVRIGPSDGTLWSHQRTFGFRNMREISWLSKETLAFQGLLHVISVEPATLLFIVEAASVFRTRSVFDTIEAYSSIVRVDVNYRLQLKRSKSLRLSCVGIWHPVAGCFRSSFCFLFIRRFYCLFACLLYLEWSHRNQIFNIGLWRFTGRCNVSLQSFVITTCTTTNFVCSWMSKNIISKSNKQPKTKGERTVTWCSISTKIMIYDCDMTS